MAPEVLAHQSYSTKADVFSFGIVSVRRKDRHLRTAWLPSCCPHAYVQRHAS